MCIISKDKAFSVTSAFQERKSNIWFLRSLVVVSMATESLSELLLAVSHVSGSVCLMRHSLEGNKSVCCVSTYCVATSAVAGGRLQTPKITLVCRVSTQ